MARGRMATRTPERDKASSLLSPSAYDDDASSIHSCSDQDTDSDDDKLQQRAKSSRELHAHDRIVLLEDEETDRLVTSSRREKEKQRRGSTLAVPNPLQMLRRSPSLSHVSASERRVRRSTSEKRTARRAKRRYKKERLMEQAYNDEDSELMYELEQGGLREGSSTGDTSELEGSDQTDLDSLSGAAHGKRERRRGCRRWIMIHFLIAVGFSILLLLAWKLSRDRKRSRIANQLVSNGTALFAPTTIIISLDGFRADFLKRDETPRLQTFVKYGVSPRYMLPSFPSVTFPNHFTLATGLYPESHGVVGNTFWDPRLQAEFYYTDPQRSLDPKWWQAEPFWATAELQGIRTAVHMWPGSQANIMGVEPSFPDKYDGEMKLDEKVSRILGFLDRPGKEDKAADVKDMRPQLIAAYVPDVDQDGHNYGPNSTEIRSTIARVDNMMGKLLQGLDERNLTGIVNVIVVSDHGMATTDRSRLLQLEDLVNTTKIEHVDGWPLYGLRPKKDSDLQALYDDLKKKSEASPNFEVYLRDVDMPPRYHFSNNERIAPLWIVPQAGWAIVTKEEFDVREGVDKNLIYHPRGLHGYDFEHPLMRAIFMARGPAFPHRANSEVPPFQNIEVYNILADSIGMRPRPNNGTLRLPLHPIGLHGSDETNGDDPIPSDKSSAVVERPTLPSHQAHTVRPIISHPTDGGNFGPGQATDKHKVLSIKERFEQKAKDIMEWVHGEIDQVKAKIAGHRAKVWWRFFL